MAASSSSASLSLGVLILLYAVASQADSRPSPHIRSHQISEHIFAEQMGSLFQNHADQNSFSGTLHGRSISKMGRQEYGFLPKNILPSRLLDFMGLQRKFKGRTRKNTSCFGLRVDHTGAVSGLGC